MLMAMRRLGQVEEKRRKAAESMRKIHISRVTSRGLRSTSAPVM
jgi:hypothetical protein